MPMLRGNNPQKTVMYITQKIGAPVAETAD